jgi:hypothetical protein
MTSSVARVAVARVAVARVAVARIMPAAVVMPIIDDTIVAVGCHLIAAGI